MKKLLIVCLTLIVGVSLLDSKVYANSEIDEFPEIPYLLVYSIDSDEIVYDKNGGETIYPASITKVLTAMVAIEKIGDLNEKVEITEEDLAGLSWAGASVVGLQPGNQVSYSDLLSSLLIISAGDSAQTLANHLFGSQEAMVEAMNTKANELGMVNSHFVNVTGLHEDDHYSTAHDLMILMRNAIENETLKAMMSTMKYSISVDAENSQLAFSHTIQMGKTQTETIENYMTGGKTGSTIEAASNLASFGEASDISYIVVAMKVNSDVNSFAAVSESKKVYEYLERTFQKYQLWEENDLIANIKIKHSWQSDYDVIADSSAYRLIDKQLDPQAIEVQYRLEEDYAAPLKSGDSLGFLDVMYNGELQTSYEIRMDKDIEYESSRYYFEQLVDNWYLFAAILILLVIIIYRLIKKRRERNKTRYRL